MWRHLPFVALCAALIATLASPPASACATAEEVARRLSETWPGSRIEYVEGAVAAAVRDGIAQITGSAIPAGGVFALVDVPGSELTYVIRFADGCATHHGRFPRWLARGWIAGLAAGE